MINVTEALLVDDAVRADQVAMLRGLEPSAERTLRARLSDPDPADRDGTAADGGDDGEVEVATITDLSAWLEAVTAMSEGAGDGG